MRAYVYTFMYIWAISACSTNVLNQMMQIGIIVLGDLCNLKTSSNPFMCSVSFDVPFKHCMHVDIKNLCYLLHSSQYIRCSNLFLLQKNPMNVPIYKRIDNIYVGAVAMYVHTVWRSWTLCCTLSFSFFRTYSLVPSLAKKNYDAVNSFFMYQEVIPL